MPTSLLPLIIPFVAWGIYRRVRRHVGRQPLQHKRLVLRIVIYALLSLVIAAANVALPRVLAGFVGGLVLGIGLGLVGLSLTRFETTPQGAFYTPNPYMGAALSVLLVTRLVYRIIVLTQTVNTIRHPPAFGQSALTLFLLGLFAGYYMAYYAGVLLRAKSPPPA
jgi:glucose uptake protein GlcU